MTVKDAEQLAGFMARYAQMGAALSHRPPIIMCGCVEWLTCEHPWPAVLRADPYQAARERMAYAAMSGLPLFPRLGVRIENA